MNPSRPSTPESGLRFECTKCGKCCTNRDEYAHVYVNPEETRALAKHLGMSTRTFKKTYTFVDSDGWRQLSFRGDRCVFLDPDTRGCRVYSARPSQCSSFPFWGEFIAKGRWTDEVRELCEGIDRGRLYSEAEVLARMAGRDDGDE